MDYKEIIPYIYAENELESSILKKAVEYERNGADALFVYNYSNRESERDALLLSV